MSDKEKCEQTCCPFRNGKYSDNCGKYTKGTLKKNCAKYTNATRPKDPLGSSCNELLAVLKYHEDAAREGREDYKAVCEDGDDTYICGVLLSLAEQHEEFARIIASTLNS